MYDVLNLRYLLICGDSLLLCNCMALDRRRSFFSSDPPGDASSASTGCCWLSPWRRPRQLIDLPQTLSAGIPSLDVPQCFLLSYSNLSCWSCCILPVGWMHRCRLACVPLPLAALGPRALFVAAPVTDLFAVRTPREELLESEDLTENNLRDPREVFAPEPGTASITTKSQTLGRVPFFQFVVCHACGFGSSYH